MPSKARFVQSAMCLVGLAGAAAPCLAQAHERSFQITLPSQPLGDALREVASLTGANIIAPSHLVEDRLAPPISGRFTARAAAQALVAATPLEVQTLGGSLVISERRAPAEAASPQQGEDGDRDTGEIVVTGSNLRGGSPTSQLLVIDRKDIEASGTSSSEELLRRLPQNSQSGVNPENFATVGDTTEQGAGVNLRGLGQRATLTLVNGRRLAPGGAGSFVDISLIPVSAVQRVEVLTDGASAIYGSDAVGGVVNFILQERFDGVTLGGELGSATQGDGDLRLVNGAAGTSWSSGEAMLSYEYRQEDSIRAASRDYVINLPQDWALTPNERRHAVLGRARQSLGGSTSLEVTGLFGHRRSRRDHFDAQSPAAIRGEGSARQAGASALLTHELGEGWQVRAGAAYFHSRTDQEQQRPEFEGLVNRLDVKSRVQEFDLIADGDLVELPGGPFKLAVGAARRDEAYRGLFETGVNPLNIKAQARGLNSLFAEAELPLIGAPNARSGLERLVLTAAARLEDYEGLRPSADPKVGLLWSPARGLDLRASWGTSFRAPLLEETVGYYNMFLYPASLLYAGDGSPPTGVAAALVGSNPDVRPETSRTWTAGMAWRPGFAPGLELTANYYAIRFEDRIAIPSTNIIAIGDPSLAAIVTLSPTLDAVTQLLGGAGQVLDVSGPGFTNGNAAPGDIAAIVDIRSGNTALAKTSGLDLGLAYDRALGGGWLSIDLNLAAIFGFEEQLSASSPSRSILDRPYGPLDLRLRGGVGWSQGPWSASLFANHAGGYRDDRRAELVPVEAFTTFDLTIGRDLGSIGRIGLVALNLFDQDPPLLATDPAATRGLGYDPVNASGRGRYVGLQLRSRW